MSLGASSLFLPGDTDSWEEISSASSTLGSQIVLETCEVVRHLRQLGIAWEDVSAALGVDAEALGADKETPEEVHSSMEGKYVLRETAAVEREYLEGTIRERSQDVARLQRELADKIVRSSALEQAANSLRMEMSERDIACERLTFYCHQKERKIYDMIESKANEEARANEKLRERDETCAQLSAECEQKVAKAREMLRERDEMCAQLIAECEQKVAQVREKLRERDEMCAQLSAEYDQKAAKAREMLRERGETCAQLSAECEQKVAKANEMLRERDETCAQLKAEFETKVVEVMSLNGSRYELRASFESKLAEVRNALEATEATCAEMKQEYAHHLVAANEWSADLRRELDGAEMTCQELRAELAVKAEEVRENRRQEVDHKEWVRQRDEYCEQMCHVLRAEFARRSAEVSEEAHAREEHLRAEVARMDEELKELRARKNLVPPREVFALRAAWVDPEEAISERLGDFSDASVPEGWMQSRCKLTEVQSLRLEFGRVVQELEEARAREKKLHEECFEQEEEITERMHFEAMRREMKLESRLRFTVSPRLGQDDTRAAMYAVAVRELGDGKVRLRKHRAAQPELQLAEPVQETMEGQETDAKPKTEEGVSSCGARFKKLDSAKLVWAVERGSHLIREGVYAAELARKPGRVQVAVVGGGVIELTL